MPRVADETRPSVALIVKADTTLFSGRGPGPVSACPALSFKGFAGVLARPRVRFPAPPGSRAIPGDLLSLSKS
jgi:hypothetical protein